ncbi:MAG: membrane protein insertion efficiency factor YidD [Chromatiales bacterium]|nr:membrane protein insertion efficiency factor YidD [Chromatiales bacterium]
MSKWHPAVAAINGYQQYISPYKGFSCAHRVATGEVSCSEFAKQVIHKKGLISALKDIFHRLDECKKVAIYLNEQKEKSKKDNPTCTAADTLTCMPIPSCGDAGIGGAASGIGAGGCDACACTPF